MQYKAFVSSTFIDLQVHRAHVVEQLRKSGFFVDPMEDWTASPDRPKEFSTNRLEGCHLCILIIARRRGYVPHGDASSITQMEYSEARRRGIDLIPFLLDDSVPESDWPWEEQELVTQWRSEVLANYGVQTFTSDPSSLAIAPALTRWVNDCSSKTAIRLYLESIKHEHGTIRFVSLPRLEDIKDVPIQKLYVEPSVADRTISSDDDPSVWPRTQSILEQLSEHQRLVLLGDPGSGKSTLVSWITWQLASNRNGESLWARQLGSLIPLPLILRDLQIGKGIKRDELMSRFVSTSAGRMLTMAKLHELLKAGQAMIILDGLDEIGSRAARQELREAIWYAMDEYWSCRWLLTSRIVGYDDVPFDHFKKDEQSNYIPRFYKHNYNAGDEVVGNLAEVRFIAPFDNNRVSQFAENWFGLREQSEQMARRRAADLLDSMQKHESMTKLARIPNMLTMMALIYRVRARLPHGRALLYNEISQAYLETIDYYRRIETRTEPLADKKRWLARIGFEMQTARSLSNSAATGPFREVRNEVFANSVEVRRWIALAMDSNPNDERDNDAIDFVEYLASRSGLLSPRGSETFAFLHLSFQEYFAACYLHNQIASPEWLQDEDGVAAGTSKKAIRHYAQNSVWRETIVFLFELVAASDQPKWLKPIVEALFGTGFNAILHDNHEETRNQSVLLARLVINPHSGFSEEFRKSAIEFCCLRESQLIKRYGLSGYSNEVFQVLFSTEASQRRDFLSILCREFDRQGVAEIDLNNTAVSDITAFALMSDLTHLELENTSVADLSCLAAATNLRHLDLGNTRVADLEPIRRLRHLRTLNLRSTQVVNLSPLEEAHELSSLDLQGTSVSTLSPICGIQGLRELWITGSKVSIPAASSFQAARSRQNLSIVEIHR